jgi:O-antigen/teichoic acid export membrane protein
MLGHGLMPLQRVLVSRLFGQTAYGIYRASADLVEVLTRAGQVGADKAMLRYVAAHRVSGEEAEETRALGSGLRMSGSALVVLALGLFLAAPLFARLWGNPAYTAVLRVLAPAVVAGGLVVVLMAATLGAKVTRVNLAVRGFSEPVLLLGGTLIAWAVRPTVLGVAVGHAAAYGLLLVLAWVGAGLVIGRRRLAAALRAPGHPTLSSFALPLGASELMNAILQRVNIFILSAYTGAPTVALYGAAEELGRSVGAVRLAFDSIITPMMSEAFHLRDHARLRYNLALMSRWVASASAPIAVTLFVLRPQLLSLYGPHYQSAAAAMAILLVGQLVNAVLGLTPYVIVMGGRSRLFFWDNVGAAALNLVLSLLLIPRFGVTGAALASTISVSALQGVLCLQAVLLEGVHPFEWTLLKPFLAAAAAMAVELAVAALPLMGVARVLLVVVLGAVTYGAVLYRLRPGEEERRFIVGIVRRLTGRKSEP